MIDPATSWIEIRFVPEARADLVADQVGLAWLIRYPLPYKITSQTTSIYRLILWSFSSV